MKRTLTSGLLLLALVVTACGDDEGTTTTAPASDQTTTTAAAGTTTTAGSGSDANAAAAKSEAVVDAAPDGWTVEVTNTLTSSQMIEQEVLFAPCLEAGSFDFATVNEVSDAAINTAVTSPIDQGPFVATASIETRVFESEEMAGQAYSVLQAVLGTTIGRECVAASSFELLQDQLPQGASAEYRVEEFLLASGDFGTSIVWVVGMEDVELSVFIDMVAYRDADCTVFAIFIGFEEPFPTPVAVQLMDAAINV